MSNEPQSMVYGGVPPETARDAVPSVPPLHVTLDIVGLNDIVSGSATVVVCCPLQPALSVMITPTFPWHKPVAMLVVCAPGSFQRYVNAPMPPVVVTETVPSQFPKQVANVGVKDGMMAAG